MFVNSLRRFIIGAGIGLCITVQFAVANCGSAFCSINTDMDVQARAAEPGLKFDLRYEYIKQNQPREGTKKVDIHGKPDSHDELETVNHNLILGADYSFDRHWSLDASLPYIKRRHAHLRNPDAAAMAAGEEPEREEWKFSGIGDARLMGRYQTELGGVDIGGHIGVKLPTGNIDGTNAAGERAERTFQLGTGSTDMIAGVFVKGRMGETALSWFSQAQWQHAVKTKDDFRPGDELRLDLGLRYGITEALSANLQINGRIKSRDSGSNAEAGESGGRFLFIAPGLSYYLTPSLEIYGYVQTPLYQRVNGVQLTQDTNFLLGMSYRF